MYAVLSVFCLSVLDQVLASSENMGCYAEWSEKKSLIFAVSMTSTGTLASLVHAWLWVQRLSLLQVAFRHVSTG